MFRMIRRAPWIALGAAGAYYLDTTSGAARRTAAAAWTRTLVERGRDRWQVTLVTASADGGAVVVVDAPLVASVSDEHVRTRADGPQAEESAAGVPAPARDAMAKTILEDSEARVTDRVGTSGESRRSEDTVVPLPI